MRSYFVVKMTISGMMLLTMLSGSHAQQYPFGNWSLSNSGNWPNGSGITFSGLHETFGISSTGGQVSLQIDGGFRQQEVGQVNYFMDQVGIGTTSPTGRLHISNSRASLYIQNTNPNDWTFLRFQGSGANHWDIGQFGNNDYLEFRPMGGDANRVVIKQNGNLGIGTTSPNSKLVVSDGVNAISMNPGIVSGFGFNRNVLDGSIFNSSISAWQFSSRDDRFTLEGYNGPPHDLFTVLKNGNVGIGTTTPGSYKLAVEGKIGAREVNVTTTAWSDHVFNADYKLRPLAEVQQYIEENHHLPEVPSEKEVLANGQNLGEMNAILLKKIEELTLYQIQAQKIINDLVKKVEVLESVVKK